MNFEQIVKALNELSSISGTNAKIDFIKNHDDERLKVTLLHLRRNQGRNQFVLAQK